MMRFKQLIISLAFITALIAPTIATPVVPSSPATSSAIAFAATPPANTFAYCDRLYPFTKALSYERGGWVGIGHSEQIFAGYGWDGSFQAALAKRWGLYGSGVISCNENTGSGSRSGPGVYVTSFASTSIASTGAPAELAAYLDKGLGLLGPESYYWLPSGSTAPTNISGALSVLTNNGEMGHDYSGDANSPFDARDGLRFSMVYGTLPTGSGSFTWDVGNPYWSGYDYGGALYDVSTTINTNTGAYSLQKATLTLAPDSTRTTNGNFAAMTSTSGHGAAVGPVFLLYEWFEQPARLTGAAYSTLEYHGGGSARNLAYDLQQASDKTLTEFLTCVRDPLSVNASGDKPVLFTIAESQNSRGDTNPSVGPNPTTSNLPAGYADNLQAIINRIRAIYALNSWPTDQLYFLIIGDQATADPDDAQVVSYRAAAATIVCQSNANTATLDMSQLLNGSEMAALGYYNAAGSDVAHMTPTGYQRLALKIIDGISPVATGSSAQVVASDIADKIAATPLMLKSTQSYNNAGQTTPLPANIVQLNGGSGAVTSLSNDTASATAKADTIISRIGSPTGLSLSVDLANIKSDTSATRTKLPSIGNIAGTPVQLPTTVPAGYGGGGNHISVGEK